VTGGTLIVTTPSFGPDGGRRHGLPINEPSWWEDARANRPFRRIVVGADGLPDCGHLTLATFRWWTERFLRHGLARNCDLELALLDEGPRPLRRHGWSLYALHEVRSPEFVVGETDRRQGGEGFGPPVVGPDRRRGRFTGARASLHLLPQPGWERAALALSVWAGPETLAHDRRLDITVAPALADEGAAPTRASFRVRPGGWRELTVPDVPVDGGIVHVSLETDPTTLPPRYTRKGAVAGPAVGVCLARAALVPTGARMAVDLEARRMGPPVLETPELRLVGIERRRGAAELTVAVTATPALEALAAQAAERGVPLRLGGHLLGENGALLSYDGPRSSPIDRRWLDLGSTVRRLAVDEPAPRVQVELVAEGLWWGAEVGLAPIEAALPPLEPPAPAGPPPGPPPPPAALDAALPAIVSTRPSDLDPAIFDTYARSELSRLMMVVALVGEHPPERLLHVNAYPFTLAQLLEQAFPRAVFERINPGGIGGAEIEHALVDPAGAQVRLVRSRVLDSETEPLPFPDGSFDTAVLSGVLTWLARDPAALVWELRRVLAADGRLILATANVARAGNARRLSDGLGIAGTLTAAGRGAPPVREYAAEELFDLLAGNGFAIERHLTRSLAPLEGLDAAWFAAADDDGSGDIHYVVARPAERSEPYRPAWLYG
ncbi:MAG: hypothetical protein QOK40_3666, partial [Miltoncostaeaceae bacterium]|nr:hypothetical protein [Miltoncostaeaceae bacterium]